MVVVHLSEHWQFKAVGSILPATEAEDKNGWH